MNLEFSVNRIAKFNLSQLTHEEYDKLLDDSTVAFKEGNLVNTLYSNVMRLVRENVIQSVYNTMKDYDETKRKVYIRVFPYHVLLVEMSQKLTKILNKVNLDRPDTLIDKVYTTME